ncbi:hypothetical protein Tco_0052634 [Tanacetum coccineum]|uniref:Uncharacterized protein n=1 Tax=Tanacetum coccineum TaxID=301880 RepID=A0ABQ5FZN1_9ASTR
MSMEALQAQEDLMKSIESFLKKFNSISFGKTPKVLLQAWDNFFEVKHAQSEEKLRKLKFLTEGVILFLESLLYDKSSPTTSEDLQANSNAYRIFCPKSHIPVADNVIFMEEIDLVFLLMTDHTTQELARIVKDSQFVILSRVSHLSFNWESDI